MKSLRILLLQARGDRVTQQEELAEFIRLSGLAAEQFTVLNGFACDDFTADCIQGFDALFIGGSSDATVLKPDRYRFVPPAMDLILACIEQEIPVLASCFGFQLAVQALGAQVIVDREAMEMGTYPLYLTPAGVTDPLFAGFPNPFLAISGHQERALTLPAGATLLAYSELCPYHAFRLEGKPFYAFQFHPEVDDRDLLARIRRYCDRYQLSTADLEQLKQTARPTPYANQLIRRFVAVVLGQRVNCA
ncbi:type 1 glutamine amidotransferase [Thermosynechococcus vestitus]|uniref:Tll0649 protein n=1 Tax=Thermosynechococcus vestitus (strain NIES-2133 / IAM M-273 / BP-1) TaxID=197221 RepID=Q8DL49_THEVB|nr:type 1 glutamine amidotransferase [Thermosynechococcus vestitus]BAC08200.1 tll0649 [Thermosynechococcus vestitus BP-1]BAY51813.1 putative amino transferase [Thermostichus vulcanus NIES-2134]